VGIYFWQHDLEPEFPLSVKFHEVRGDADRMHWHDYLEIALVLDGSGAFRFGRREIEAGPRDIFMVDNSEPHAALARHGGLLRLLLILFRPELIAPPGCRGFDARYLSPFRNADGSYSNRIPAGTGLADDVAATLHDLSRIWQRGDPADRHLLDAALRHALALVIRDRHATREGDGAVDALGCGQIRPALDFVERSFRESLTLEEVAAHVHVSPSRLRHLVKEVTGVGFKEYLTNLRLAEAKRLLLATDAPVCEVAAAVSYTNLSQFYTVFHRYCSMSPAEYRRHYMPGAVSLVLPSPTAVTSG